MGNCVYELLIGRIICIFGNRKAFADAMGMSDVTLRSKLSGRFDFKSSEIVKACELLNISNSQIGAYFFANAVN